MLREPSRSTHERRERTRVSARLPHHLVASPAAGPELDRTQLDGRLTGFVALAILAGVPTDVLPTPLYTRMTPVVWWDYALWAVAAILAGLASGGLVGRRLAFGRGESCVVGGGLLTGLAIGCPICNKLVIAVLGVSGALSYFAPLQPLLGLLSILLLAASLVVQSRSRGVVPTGRLVDER